MLLQHIYFIKGITERDELFVMQINASFPSHFDKLKSSKTNSNLQSKCLPQLNFKYWINLKFLFFFDDAFIHLIVILKFEFEAECIIIFTIQFADWRHFADIRFFLSIFSFRTEGRKIVLTFFSFCYVHLKVLLSLNWFFIHLFVEIPSVVA